MKCVGVLTVFLIPVPFETGSAFQAERLGSALKL